MQPANAQALIYSAIAMAIAPRKPITVSEWADAERVLSAKGSAEPGQWRTDRHPPLREPMDCLSARSSVKDTVLMFPVQAGKTEVAANALAYTMLQNPGPVMVCLPGEVSMHKWVNQKLNPLIEETPTVAACLSSVASRDASNTRTFKDFTGGQLYLEHAGSPSRLKSTSVKIMLVDELDEFAANFPGGDDPLDMLLARTSAFPASYKRLFISTPQIKGFSRIEELWNKSDQRRYHVPCPHCGHLQYLEWSGLKWDKEAASAWYICQDCGTCIDEHHKTAMIRAGKWIPAHPERPIRGYHLNCLYYQIGLGPRWAELARMWLDCQNDPARLKTFINDRLAEPWEDRATRAAKFNIIADRAESYRLREAPNEVLTLTAGVDTQDNRLAVQIVGWGRGMTAWILDYVELMGDPAEDAVWVKLTDLLNRPIERQDGTLLNIQATAIDAGGHRTEPVKSYCRARHIRRPMAIFGAVPNNAPVLSRPKFQEIKWRNTTDKKGQIYHVGTVAVKHVLFSLLSIDGDAESPEKRRLHFSQDLDRFYFEGITSETFDPRSNRYVKKRGARNEPLDTWVYAYAAAHHSELRYHTFTQARWQALADSYKPRQLAAPATAQPNTPTPTAGTSGYYIPD
jgi:phage terminase large subunit GpA-like protein